MSTVRTALAGCAREVALHTGVSLHVARSQPVYRIIMHHGVGPGDLDAAAFERQLVWLARSFNVVALDALLAKVAQGASPAGELALTFDDGLSCHAEIVVPILRRLGLPATFFICPVLIEQQRWLWSHEVRERLRFLSAALRADMLAQLHGAASDIEPFIVWMKQLTLPKRQQVEETIRSASAGFAPSAQQRGLFDPLTWAQMPAFDSPLFTIGSHSSTHAMLPTLEPAQLEQELAGSRALLENRLDRVVDLFCYPSGAVDARVRIEVTRTYRAAVSTRKGLITSGDDLYSLARIPVAHDVSSLAWRMFRPAA